jgi:hypothetical protein
MGCCVWMYERCLAQKARPRRWPPGAQELTRQTSLRRGGHVACRLRHKRIRHTHTCQPQAGVVVHAAAERSGSCLVPFLHNSCIQCPTPRVGMQG